VLLADGRVLVTGGQRAPTTTEIFDPTNGTWKPARSMNVGHQGHTATTLRDGRVLVVGGFEGPGSTRASKKVEIYDPAMNRWSFAADMDVERVNHTANLLADGRVLVLGGRDQVQTPDYFEDSEIYDPSTNTWSEGPSLVQSRAWHTATSLANGTIVVTGGMAGSMQTSGRPPITAYVDSERRSVEVLGTSSGGKLGGACTDASGCESGFCVDGVCCDSACGGGVADCQACSVKAGGTSNGHCSIAKPKTVCRPVQPGCACDVAETCDGTSAECPADTFVAAGTLCRAAAGSCDLAEVCTGNHPFCGDDDFKPNGAACDVVSCNSHGTCKSGECIPDVGMCQ
jgi:N-acetylneuraminic acid mutarotase